MKIKVKNDLGQAKEIKIGFSWTMFFWGIFVPLFRTDWKHFFIIFGVSVVLGFIGFAFLVPFIMLVLSFMYNKMYASDLYKDGYRGLTPEEDEILVNYITK